MKIKTGVLIVVAVVVIALTTGTAWASSSSVIQQGFAFEATYTANIPNTLNGSDVTNLMIFEKDSVGNVRVVAFPYTLAPGDVSVLSDTLIFSPTSTLIAGLDYIPPSGGTGKMHLVMFVSDAFAASAASKDFSQMFPPVQEQAFIEDLLKVYWGWDHTLLQDYFANGPLDSAAFTPGGSFSVVECSTFSPVPEPATMLFLVFGLVGVVGAIRKFKE